MLGKSNAISVYLAWLFLTITIFVFVAAMLDIYKNENVLIYCFLSFISFSFFHLALGFFVRCPHCNKCITVQGFNKPHPMSDGSWSKTVIKWFSGYVRCIHCGNGVKTNGI